MRLPALCYHGVLVLLLAYGLFLVGLCATALQLLVSVFLYTSIVPRPVEFVKWPGAATRVHPEARPAPWSGVLWRAVPPPLGGALVCVGWGVGGGVLSSGGLR